MELVCGLCGLRASSWERGRSEEWLGESEMWLGSANSGGWRSPQAFTGTLNNTREPAQLGKKKPQPRTVGVLLLVAEGEYEVSFERMRIRAERCGFLRISAGSCLSRDRLSARIAGHSPAAMWRPAKRCATSRANIIPPSCPSSYDFKTRASTQPRVVSRHRGAQRSPPRSNAPISSGSCWQAYPPRIQRVRRQSASRAWCR